MGAVLSEATGGNVPNCSATQAMNILSGWVRSVHNAAELADAPPGSAEAMRQRIDHLEQTMHLLLYPNAGPVRAHARVLLKGADSGKAGSASRNAIFGSDELQLSPFDSDCRDKGVMP